MPLVMRLELTRHWRTMSPDAHFGAIGLVVSFPALWAYLLSERSSISTIVVSSLAFASAIYLIFPGVDERAVTLRVVRNEPPHLSPPVLRGFRRGYQV